MTPLPMGLDGEISRRDRIEVQGLRVLTVVGVLPHERQHPQPVLIDLAIEVDLAEAGHSDSLASTVDYAALCQSVAARVREGRDILLERLAQRIADLVLEMDRVEAVEVAVAKLRPALPEDLASTKVCIRRCRPKGAGRRASSAAERYRAYIALGSNLGDRAAQLRFATSQLPGVVAESSVYETRPVGGPADQGPYLNMVVAIDTELEPLALLRRLLAIEARAGRERREPNGPRVLDLDLLLYDRYNISGPGIQVPHPRMEQRRFVLQPLSDIAADRCPPGWERHLPEDGIRRLGRLADL